MRQCQRPMISRGGTLMQPTMTIGQNGLKRVSMLLSQPQRMWRRGFHVTLIIGTSILLKLIFLITWLDGDSVLNSPLASLSLFMSFSPNTCGLLGDYGLAPSLVFSCVSFVLSLQIVYITIINISSRVSHLRAN